MSDEEDPDAEVDWGNVEEVGSDDDEDDDNDHDNGDMDDSGEDNDEEESDNDDDDDDDDDEENMKNLETFMSTFHNGDFDTEFDNVFSSHRRENVALAHRPTQASYNKPDNWIERNRIGLEMVKSQLQTCIDSVKHDTSFNLKLEHDNYHDRDEEPIVWHEPILDEYWDRLEKKVNGLLATDIHTIYISNVEIKKEHLAALVAMFLSGRATNSSECITFDNANLCREGITLLAKLIETSPMLRDFRLYHNRIDNMDSARCLSRSLKSHTGITLLDLDHCDLGSSPEILSVILHSDISLINLSNNNIDSLGAIQIAECLRSNPLIQSIFLSCNRLNDDDAILISQALKRNTNLRRIFLHTNNLTSIGVKDLLSCVFDNSNLNAISESNHTLFKIDFFADDNNRQFKRLQGCIDRLLDLDRTEKLLLALQDKDSLLQYLANVPVELIPEVLAFPCGQADNQHQYKHLNVLYSTMRWWNMPMLYSYHHCCTTSNTKRKRNHWDIYSDPYFDC